MVEQLVCTVECRASESGPMLRGVIVQEGRAARGGRRELFAPGAVTWPADGIAIRGEHLGPELARAVPVRGDRGEVRIEAPASPSIMAAVGRRNQRYLSVEFHALREVRTTGGVREIELAIVTAAALTDRPEYHQARAEVRERRRRWWR